MSDQERPGVANPKIIDLIGQDPKTGEVVLTMFESREWPHEEQLVHSRVVQLQNKIDSYVSYVIDGYLKQHYPKYSQLPVKIELKCIEKPRDDFADFMLAAEDFASTYQIVFKCNFNCQEEIETYYARQKASLS